MTDIKTFIADGCQAITKSRSGGRSDRNGNGGD